MTGSASPPTGNSHATGPLVTTRRADVVQWESCFRPQDIPIPEGFEEIDSLVLEYERDPVKAEALKAAHQRLANMGIYGNSIFVLSFRLVFFAVVRDPFVRRGA